MGKVNLRKAASYVSRENKGARDVDVANTSEDIYNYNQYLIDNHSMAEIVALFEELY